MLIEVNIMRRLYFVQNEIELQGNNMTYKLIVFYNQLILYLQITDARRHKIQTISLN